MKKSTKIQVVLAVTCLLCMFTISFAQAFKDDDDYTKMITQRADKIVDKVEGLDSSKQEKVREVMVGQYRSLNAIDTEFDTKKKELKEKLSKEEAAVKLPKLEEQKMKKRAKLHAQYLKKLNKELTSEQVNQVKNEMTYNVLPITYKGYVEMLPTLSDVQKRQILDYLTEARELAMDGGSSQEKHAWFGKYKGRINNYLSKEGVETKLAREAWEKKIKERQEQGK